MKNKGIILFLMVFVIVAIIYSVNVTAKEGSDKGRGNSDKANAIAGGSIDVRASPLDDSDDSLGNSNGNGNYGNNNDEESEDEDLIVDERGNVRKVKVEIETGQENGKTKNKIKVDGDEAETELEIEEEGNKIKVKLSNGNSQIINVMPDRAFQIANNVLLTDDVVIVLKEIGSDVVYVAETKKKGRFLFFIPVVIETETVIDSETGEVLKFKKKNKLKAFFTFGEDNDETSEQGKKVTLCHVPKGNPEAKHTIVVGKPAVRAHLTKHGGDFLGTCEGEDDGNETDNNETTPIENLTLSIISPEEKNYTMNDILVNISSNGDFVWFSINDGMNETYTLPILKTFNNGSNTITAYTNDSNGTIVMDSVMFNVFPENISDENKTVNETLFLVIISPENITYTTEEILVNVSTNADTVIIDDGIINETYINPFFRNFTNGSHTLFFYGNNSVGDTITKDVTFIVAI